MQQQQFNAGDVIFAKGDESNAAYIILSGRVEVVKYTDDAQDHVGVLLSGSMFGEIGMIEQQPRAETARALEPVTVEVLNRDDFTNLFQTSSVEIQKLIAALTSKIKDLKHYRREEGQGNAEQIAEALDKVAQAVALNAPASFVNEEERCRHQQAAPLQDAPELQPIQQLIEDDSVTDILINGAHDVFVERAGRLSKTDIHFADNDAVLDLAEYIVKQVNRKLDPHRPMVDARLLDGSRVNIIAAPLAVDAPTISIRKFSRRAITLDAMREQHNMSAQIAEFLKIVGKCRMNVLISGGTGSGKTTLLNAISQHIGMEERIVTIEDAAELQLQQPHVVRLETKPLSTRGRPEDEVSMRDLVKNALRMRPDRIIVGEVRGPEAFDMMQAMNTGHEGSMSTVHANHPRDALSRIENMISMANLQLPMRSVRTQIASALHLIVQVSRMRDGHRRIMYITEVVGIEGDTITMQDLFSFEVKGEGKDGLLTGTFHWNDIMPRFLRRIAYYGEYENMGRILGVKLPKL